MGNLKDEGKKMDPLFPRLHISDADKGGPRTPPRNKMALSQQLNLPLQTTTRCIPGSVSPILPLSTNNGSSLVPATSSYHDASYKRSVFSSFGSSCGSTRLATRLDSYHSNGINLNISLTTVKQTIETTNCQTLCNSGQLKRGDYPLYKPQDFKTTRTTSMIKKIENEDDYLVPSLTFTNGQHGTNKGKFIQLKANAYKDTTQENKLNTIMIKDIAQEPISSYSDRVHFSEMLSGELTPSTPKKRSILLDEPQMLHDSNSRLPLKRKLFQECMTTYKDGISLDSEQGTRITSSSILPLLGDNRKIDKGNQEVVAPNNKSEEDHSSIQLGDVGNNGDILETKCVSTYNLTPEEVSQIIGPEQYSKARRTIIQQQRVFQSQLFELHRLIKVQKLLAESPDLFLEDNFYKLKKIPSEDIFPHVDHHKKEACFSFHTNNERYNNNPNPIDLPLPPPPPPTTIGGGKQPPWCLFPPPGNQWLVPVRSPSEGLVYKPYTGPCPPPVGLMAPIYSMSLTPSNGDFINYNINHPTVFPNTSPLLSSYGLPPLTKRSCSPTMEDNIKYRKPIKPTCNNNIIEKWSSLGEVQNAEKNNKETSDQSCGYERKKSGNELALFPTTPMALMVHDHSDHCTEEKGYDDEKIKVIKVVPHNPKLASESAARIFQFIQEERKQNE